ncbi:MAG TPA: hypothetical protein VFZ88_02640 [Sphingomicrobium sp.]|jgi:hypothetical protein
MSMSLYLWKAPVIDDPDKARALIDRYYDQGEISVFERSEDVVRTLARIRENYSDAAGNDDNPWSSWPIEDSDRIIELNIRWSVDGEVLDTIVAIAAEHDLVVYDPQGPDVYRAVDANADNGPIPRPTPWEWFKTFAIPAVLVALTYAAWQIPIGWIRWPLVVVTGFVASAGIFVLVLALLAAVEIIKVDEQA